MNDLGQAVWLRDFLRGVMNTVPTWAFLVLTAGVAIIVLVRWRPQPHELRFAWRIAASHLRSRRSERAISAITLISIIGVVVGVMALIIVLSVMAGFEIDMRDKILGSNAHVVVLQYGGAIEDPQAVGRLEKLASDPDEGVRRETAAALAARYCFRERRST